MRIGPLLDTDAPRATILVRLMVGLVFLSEGFLKFVDPASVGAGRFARIGIPAPDLTASLVGSVEMICGALVLVGLLTRLAAIPLIAVMLGAIVTTKIPIFLGRDLGPFVVRDLDRYGLLSMAHESRTDWSMLLGAIFLAIVGAGAWSLDAWFARRGRSGARLSSR